MTPPWPGPPEGFPRFTGKAPPWWPEGQPWPPRRLSFSPRRPPPWWPEGEPWPPPGWRRRRQRFMMRAAGFFTFMLVVGATACIGSLWLLGLLRDSGPSLSTLAVVIVIVGALVLVNTFGAVRRSALSLGDLIEAAGEVEEGDYSARVRVRGPRELRLLGRAFNDMAERLQVTESQRRNTLAELTHELRTPVAVIQGNLEGMLDGIYPADPSHLTPVLEEVRQLGRLIDDLRTLSLSESGALTLSREPTDLEVLAGEVAAAYRPQAEEKGVRLRLEFREDLPLVEADPVRIREVLVNLMTNALRHTPTGGEVAIGAGMDPSGRALEVSVTDTGTGIRAEDLPHVFDRFYKSDGSGGSGLGLTIARSLVTAHGGEIRAENRPGSGAVVRFTLPIRRYNPEP